MRKLLPIFTFMLFIACLLQAQTPVDSLIAKYPFNKSFNDETGNGNNGTAYGVVFDTDRFGFEQRAAKFNGTSDYFSVGTMSKLNASLNNFSISFWMKTDTVGKTHYETIMKTINDAPMGTLLSIEVLRGAYAVYTPGALRLDIRDESDKYFTIYVKRPDIFDDNWHHVVFVVDSASGNKGNVYIDTMLTERDTVVFAGSNPVTFNPFDHELAIGAANNRGTIETFYKGDLDNIRFYNSSLSIADIQQLYYEGLCHESVYDTITVSDTIYDTITVSDTIYDTITVSDTLAIELELSNLNVTNSFIIKVYPNPTKNKLYFSVSNLESLSGYSIRIMNTMGEQVYSSSITQKVDEISLSDIGSKGLYFLQIVNDKSKIIDVRKILLN